MQSQEIANGTYDNIRYHITDAQFSTVAILDDSGGLEDLGSAKSPLDQRDQ